MNTVKQIVFMDRKTGLLYSDRTMKAQLLCRKHNCGVTRALTESMLSMYLNAVFWCERGKHRLKFYVPYEIFPIDRQEEDDNGDRYRKETIEERMARRKRGESIKHIDPEDGITEIEEF